MHASICLFTGKGGVGKTTLAAATAVDLAVRGYSVLAVSIDPAHSLADVYGVPLGPDPSTVDLSTMDSDASTLGRLSAAQIDVRGLADHAWQHLQRHLGVVLAGAGVDELTADAITVLPGIEEILSLVEVCRLADLGQWDVLIVDCGPTAETLRLMSLPESLAGYIERIFPMHRRVVRGLLANLAGNASIEEWDSVIAALGRLADTLTGLRAMLTADRTAVRLVCTPERVIAAETEKTLTALALHDITVDSIAINRIIPAFDADHGPAAQWLSARRAEQELVLDDMSAWAVPVHRASHQASEPVGISALLALARELYQNSDPFPRRQGTPHQLISVTKGERGPDLQYRLRIGLPLADNAELDLVRVGDELAVTIDGRRRMFALPSVLRRCALIGAQAATDGVVVEFQPDPRLWTRAGS